MNLKLKLSIDYYIGGMAHVVCKPAVILLSKVLKRDHSLARIDEVTIVKMLGGGSLVIAYPSFLALKKKHPHLKLSLVTTPSIRPFAEALGIFDEIVLIDDGSFFPFVKDSFRAIVRLWRSQVLVDLEIHSRLSAIFTLLTCAIDRVGIYTDVSYWRRNLYTHLLFYNKQAPIYCVYDQIAALLGVEQIDFAEAREVFKSHIAAPASAEEKRCRLGVAAGCSELGRERRLTPRQWARALEKRCAAQENVTVSFLGGPGDRKLSDEIIDELRRLFPQAEYDNTCGKLDLRESIGLLARQDTLYCIDSALLHFAGLLGVPTISYWGPTDPASRLRPEVSAQGETHYGRLSCSPCVHITAEAPCYGRNICMEAALAGEDYTGDRNPIWLARDEPFL